MHILYHPYADKLLESHICNTKRYWRWTTLNYTLYWNNWVDIFLFRMLQRIMTQKQILKYQIKKKKRTDCKECMMWIFTKSMSHPRIELNEKDALNVIWDNWRGKPRHQGSLCICSTRAVHYLELSPLRQIPENAWSSLSICKQIPKMSIYAPRMWMDFSLKAVMKFASRASRQPYHQS